jgi:hypothetical protein
VCAQVRVLVCWCGGVFCLFSARHCSENLYRGAQLAIAAKWCYVVYNKASYKGGGRTRPRQRTGAGEAEQQSAGPRSRPPLSIPDVLADFGTQLNQAVVTCVQKAAAALRC